MYYVCGLLCHSKLFGGRHLYTCIPFCPHAPFSCSATWQETRPPSSITSSSGSTTSVYSVYRLPHTTTSYCLHYLHLPQSSRDDHTPSPSHGSTHRCVTCELPTSKVVLFPGPTQAPPRLHPGSTQVPPSFPLQYGKQVMRSYSRWDLGIRLFQNCMAHFWLHRTVQKR